MTHETTAPDVALDRAPGNAASEEEVVASIVAIAREHLDDAERFDVAREDLASQRLVADLGLDSVQLLTLAMEVENHFQIILDEVDPEGAYDGIEEAPPGDEIYGDV